MKLSSHPMKLHSSLFFAMSAKLKIFNVMKLSIKSSLRLASCVHMKIDEVVP